MARKSFDIDKLTDTEDIVNKIINQANSLNKKIKAFKEKGIEEHGDYLSQLLTSDIVKFNEDGSISKSKNFYKNKNQIWLKKSLSAIRSMNNHDFYGTVNKYNKEMTTRFRAVKTELINALEEKNYSKEYIDKLTNKKDYFAMLYMAFNDKENKLPSDQTIEKITLQYESEGSGYTKEEVDKILSNFEHSNNTLKRIQEENEAVAESIRLRNNAIR